MNDITLSSSQFETPANSGHYALRLELKERLLRDVLGSFPQIRSAD